LRDHLQAAMRGRILVVDHTTPTPDQDSGSASAFSYLQILSRSGFEVTFAPFDLADLGRHSRALNDLGITTLAAPQWSSMNAIIDAIASQFDVLILYRGPIAAQLFDRARHAAPAARILFHPVDLHFLRMQREATLTGDKDLAESARAMQATEMDLIGRADASIVVSNYEFRLLRQQLPKITLYHVPILREPPPLSVPVGFAGRRDILFIGGFKHSPNVDAVRWFIRGVWPRVQAQGFPHRFIIAGANMPDEVAAMASAQIDARGYVADLSALFDHCRLTVAPLRFGGGIKGKIVTSLSYGVPVVATSIAAEGMGMRHDDNVLVADQPDEMAGQILRLYTDPDLWQRLSSNGYRFFLDNFSLTVGASKVLAIIDGLMQSRVR
jgi:glycosyltransferase involved in cell wall biosynthesis